MCSSRYWFNYRHVANTLSIYRSVKRLGIPDRYDLTTLVTDWSGSTCSFIVRKRPFCDVHIKLGSSHLIGTLCSYTMLASYLLPRPLQAWRGLGKHCELCDPLHFWQSRGTFHLQKEIQVVRVAEVILSSFLPAATSS